MLMVAKDALRVHSPSMSFRDDLAFPNDRRSPNDHRAGDVDALPACFFIGRLRAAPEITPVCPQSPCQQAEMFTRHN